jgi:hypothetical protein
MPESPRFLISKGKNEQALQILAKYHVREILLYSVCSNARCIHVLPADAAQANGDDQDPLVQLEYAEIVEAIEAEKAATKGSSYIQFFKTKGNRHRLIICILVGFMCQWAG